MSRIKEERFSGKGDKGQDLIRYTDTVSGEVIKEISVRPIEKEEKEVKIAQKAKEVIIEKPLMSAEEMTKLAVKIRGATVGKKVKELIRDMLDKAEENILSGKYVHTLDKNEVNPSLNKDIISTLKGLGYTVRKRATEEGINLTISWKTTIPKTEKTRPSTVRAREIPQDSQDLTFEFQPKKD